MTDGTQRIGDPMSAPGLTPTTFTHATDDGERVWLLGGLYTYKATGDETDNAYSLFQVKGPGGLATPMHRHEREEEGFYVVDGAVTVFADDAEHELAAGGFAFVPRGTSHGFRLDSSEATLLLLISPGGAGHEGMFREMGEPAPAAALPAPSSVPIDPALLAAIAERHGTIITGPPPLPR
jgi:quercetin dioxygenase-like cupin family protein